MISICRSAATLSAALPSWCSPIRALTTVRPSTTRPVETSWMATMLTTAAPTSTSCIRSRYWRRNAFQPGSLASSASLFGPYRCRRLTHLGGAQADGGIDVQSAAGLLGGEPVPIGLGSSGVTLVLRTLRVMMRLPG